MRSIPAKKRQGRYINAKLTDDIKIAAVFLIALTVNLQLWFWNLCFLDDRIFCIWFRNCKEKKGSRYFTR